MIGSYYRQMTVIETCDARHERSWLMKTQSQYLGVSRLTQCVDALVGESVQEVGVTSNVRI